MQRLRLRIKEANKKPKPLMQRVGQSVVGQSVTPAGTGAQCALRGCSLPGSRQSWLGWSCARGMLGRSSTCKGWTRECKALQCPGVTRHLCASLADGMQRYPELLKQTEQRELWSKTSGCSFICATRAVGLVWGLWGSCPRIGLFFPSHVLI